MGGGYVIALENFKEAEKQVAADTDPTMFHLLNGLQSLTAQVEADFVFLRSALSGPPGPTLKKSRRQKSRVKMAPAKRRAKAARRSR
jgi:hypothetical protein